MKTIVALILIACSIALITVQQVQAEGEGKGGSDAKAEGKAKVDGVDAKPEISKEDEKKIDINEITQKLNAEFELPFSFSIILRKVYNGFDLHTFEDGIKSIQKELRGIDRIAAYVAVYGVAQALGKLDSPHLVSLAFLLKEEMKVFKADSTGLELANQLKDKLPKSVKNLAFADCVIIRRKAKSEDMFAAVSKKDPKRRNVFTWIPGEIKKNNQKCWAVEPMKNEGCPIATKFFIKNRKSKEYFYAVQDKLKINNKRRSVFTWIPASKAHRQNAWIFEPSGEDMYIKAAAFGEYLSTDNKMKVNDKRRIVYTIKKKSPNGLWSIECGDE